MPPHHDPNPDDRPIVHLVCNAHIDPVWKWPWEEGARETVSTFRTAADLLDEFPEFIFNHNESLLYEWVEEYDPPLFARIRALVREGRWNISGGWYLQPDCNLPGGETLVRVILEGRRYFAEKFDVRPTVAYNFDTFGHPGSLPQLLAGSGFELYIHFRPQAHELNLPAPVYRWRGVDGSEVLAIRPDSGWYCTPSDKFLTAEAQADNGIAIARATGRDVLVTWGVGDHGGGPSRQQLLAFRSLIAAMADQDVIVRHSTPEAYLARLKAQAADQAPLFQGELQRTLPGCYTSVAPIKRQLREGEALLASAERWASIAWWRFGWPYPAEELRQGWKRLLLNTFHDILPGSLLETAIPGVDDMFGYAHDVARRIVVRSQHALLPAAPPEPDTIPLYVLNPHGSPLRAPVAGNFLRAYAGSLSQGPFRLYDDAGQPVTHQESGGSPILEGSSMQPFLGFVADVPPFTARRYEIRFEDVPTPPAGPLAVTEGDGRITVENTWWRVAFDHGLAAPVALIERESGRDLLGGAVQLFAMHDTAHAWGDGQTRFNIPVSPFAALRPAEVGDLVGLEGREGPALRVIHRGPVSVTVECLVGWQHTRASLQFTLYADLPYLDIQTRLYMQARQKMIKLVFPFALPGARAICEVPYGAAERPADATEYPCGRWLRLETPDMTVGLANSGQSAFDVSADGVLGLSLSRGAIYACWELGRIDPARSYTFMDQEPIDTRFRLLAGRDRGAVAASLIPAALELNQPLEHFFVYHPPTPPEGAPADPTPFIQAEPATVVVSALKKAACADALIVRLAETVGQATAARITLEGTHSYTATFRPFEVKTFRLRREGGDVRWEPTNLLEEG